MEKQALMQMNMQNQLMYHNIFNISNHLNEMGMGMQPMINPMSSMNQQMEFMYGPNIKENDERKRNNSDEFNVIFRRGDHAIIVQCLKSEKVSDLIQKYRNESGDSDCSKKFIFNGKQLNGYLTVAEVGIVKDANIFVVPTKGIKGGGYPMMFSDVSKNKTKEIFFSKSAPSYRKAGKGINIFGICPRRKCKAFNKEVVIPIKKKIFDLIKEKENLFCPECDSLIIPKTVGFYLCKFRIYGKKIENDEIENFQNEDDVANNKKSLKYFDPDLNGEVMVIELNNILNNLLSFKN